MSQQEKLNSQLLRVQQEKDLERFKLIEQLQEGLNTIASLFFKVFLCCTQF